MTVKQLICTLQDCDPEAEVDIHSSATEWDTGRFRWTEECVHAHLVGAVEEFTGAMAIVSIRDINYWVANAATGEGPMPVAPEVDTYEDDTVGSWSIILRYIDTDACLECRDACDGGEWRSDIKPC